MTALPRATKWYRGHRSEARERVDRWQAANPEKRRAHHLVERAKKNGTLVLQPCESCGSTERIEAHHEDYSRPLDVKWLCRTCHRAADATRREIDAAIYGGASA